MTKRKLKCLDHIPTAEATAAWRAIHARRQEWAQVVTKWAASEGFAEDRGRSAEERALMRATGWSATMLFDMPEHLGPDRIRKLANLCFAYERAWEETIWHETFGDFAAALDADVAAIARGLRANPKAGYRAMSEAELRRLIWDKDIKPRLPADFIDEFAHAGPWTPEEVANISGDPYKDFTPEVFFSRVFDLIREAGVGRDVAARWTREVISTMGFDTFPTHAQVWDALVAEEEGAERKRKADLENA